MSKQSDFPEVQGEVCTLRVLRLEDAHAWQAGEDDEQRRWFEFPSPAPYENVVRAIENWRHQWEVNGPIRQWGVWTAGELAGGVELQLRDDNRASISYVVFAAFRRRGIARAAVEMASDWGFARFGVDAVVGVVDQRNAASRSVLRSAGFSEDGLAEPWEYDESGVMVRYVLWRPTRTR